MRDYSAWVLDQLTEHLQILRGYHRAAAAGYTDSAGPLAGSISSVKREIEMRLSGPLRTNNNREF